MHTLVSLLLLGSPAFDRRVKNFVALFSRAGYTCRVYYAVPGDPTSNTLEQNGATWIQLPLTQQGGPGMFFAYHRRLMEQVDELASSELILSCDLYGLAAAAQAKRQSRRCILAYDARELYTGLPTVTNKLFARQFWKRWERRGLLETDFMIVTAPDDANAIFHVHSFIPRPILIRNIPMQTNAILRADLSSYGVRADQRVVVYVGGLQGDRGLKVAVASLEHLPQDHVLLLLGDGSERDTLQQHARKLGVQDRVLFAGATRVEDVIPILSACNVGISLIETTSSSYKLALPSKVFEYLAAGLPVVTTRLDHLTATFRAEPWLLYVDEPEPQHLAAKISEALHVSSDPLIQAAMIRAQSEFSFERDFDPFQRLLEERLKERP